MIHNFNEWLNEGMDPTTTIEKTTPIFEEWAKKLGLAYESYIPNYGSLGANYYIKFPLMGVWTLILEKSQRSTGRQDSMYRPQYEKSENYKWYIKFPVRYSQYSPRNGYLAGNLKSFQALILKVMEVEEVFNKVKDFADLLGFDKDMQPHFSGKNQKELSMAMRVGSGDIYAPTEKYPEYRVRYESENRYENVSFDHTKGEFYYYGFLLLKPKLELENLELIEEVLEVLKDKPVEKVWETIKSGDWDKIAKDTSGIRSGRKFGLN